MKINPLDRSTAGQYKKPIKIKSQPGKDFSSTLDMAKKDQRKIEEMLDKIKDAGERLKITKTKEDILEYKLQIQAYLAFVLENFYRIRQDYEMGRLLIRVEVINKKIEELTEALLEQQKTNFEFVGKIDEITGLLLDLYH